MFVNDKPIFTATARDGKLLVSVFVFDRHGDVVAVIEENKWVINKNNYYKMETRDNEVKVINQQNELALHCTALPDGSVKVNGTFWVGEYKIVVTDEEVNFVLPPP